MNLIGMNTQHIDQGIDWTLSICIVFKYNFYFPLT